MRIGLFTDSHLQNDEISRVIQYLGQRLVGVCPMNGYGIKTPYAQVFETVDELMACSDVVLLLTSSIGYEQLAPLALRRGMPTFISKLTHCDITLLQQLSVLNNELRTPIGFGFAGMELKQSLTLSAKDALFLKIDRVAPEGTDYNWLLDMVTIDMATFVRTTGVGGIRRVRTVAFPFSPDEFNLLNISIELSNGGLFCYTIHRLGAKESFNFLVYGQGMSSVKGEVDGMGMPNGNTYEEFIIDPIRNFLESTNGNQKLTFTLDHAIETQNVVNEVRCKLNQFQ